MKAVFAAAQLGHSPSRFLSLGKIVDYPEAPERARRLLQGARTAGARIHAARNYGIDAIEAVHRDRYLQFLASAFEEWSKLPGSVLSSCQA
jgi:acetoin utilization deacetylase AcuC-like enzyme